MRGSKKKLDNPYEKVNPASTKDDSLPSMESNSAVASLNEKDRYMKMNVPTVEKFQNDKDPFVKEKPKSRSEKSDKAIPIHDLPSIPGSSQSRGKASVKSDQQDFKADFNIAVLERDDSGPYGCGGCAPSFLQFRRQTPTAFLIVLFILMTSNFYMHSVGPASFLHLQRRFSFSTTQFASMQSAYEFGTLIMLFPVAYFGEFNAHRPQWIGIGGVVAGIGGLTVAASHLFHDVENMPESHGIRELCDTTPGPMATPECHSHNGFMGGFVLGEFLIGVGMAPCIIMGLTFLDENATHRQSSMYTAILSMCQLIGPTISCVITGQLLWYDGDMDKRGISGAKEYHKAEKVDMWYGAWWISMLIGVAISWIGAALMFPFPKELSGATVAHIRNTRERMMTNEKEYQNTATVEANIGKKFKDFISNGVFLGILLENCARLAVVKGLKIFLPYYRKVMFNVTGSGLWKLGGVIGGFGIGGMIYGTIAQYWLRLNVRGNLRLCTVASGLAAICSLVFLMRGPSVHLYGHSKDYPTAGNSSGDLWSDCNRNCPCGQTLEIVCDDENTTLKENLVYYSRCYAGCKRQYKINKTAAYGTHCTCTPGGNGTVSHEFCPKFKLSDFHQWAFFLGFGWFCVAIYGRWNSVQQIMLRSVDFKMRGIALVLAEASGRLFGSVPAPLLFSQVLISACSYYKEPCRKQKHCIWYDRKKLANVMTMAVSVASTFAFLGTVLALVVYSMKLRQQLITAATKLQAKTEPPSKARKEKRRLFEQENERKSIE